MSSTLWAYECGDNYQATCYDREGACRTQRELVRGLRAHGGPTSNRSWGEALSSLPGAGLFLPVGFPDSVRPEYLEYQAWDTVRLPLYLYIC